MVLQDRCIRPRPFKLLGQHSLELTLSRNVLLQDIEVNRKTLADRHPWQQAAPSPFAWPLPGRRSTARPTAIAIAKLLNLRAIADFPRLAAAGGCAQTSSHKYRIPVRG